MLHFCTRLLVVGLVLVSFSWAQPGIQKLLSSGLRYQVDTTGKHYVQVTALNQTWIKFTELNPNSTVFGDTVGSAFDISLRRTRFQVIAPLNNKFFFYAQLGQNNFNYLSSRKSGFFLHDAVTELSIKPGILSIGAGLNAWTGPLRYSSPSVGVIMGADAPIYQQTTADISDQFLRKLGIYAKGYLSKLEYRVSLDKPMAIQQMSGYSMPVPGGNAGFSPLAPKLQTTGYLAWHFHDTEQHLTPYSTGTYLGKKRIFNIGAGWLFQPDAMMKVASDGKRSFSNLLQIGGDVVLDLPINKDKGTDVTAYAAALYTDYGKNFLRMVGVNNPANGGGIYSGYGNAFPMNGTGFTGYFQTGYKFRNGLLKSWGTLQPYISAQISDFDGLNDLMIVSHAGLNWLIYGHNLKMTLDWQNRPVYTSSAGKITAGSRKNQIVLQMQAFF